MTQVVYSTNLYKFFKYAENRDIAKQVLLHILHISLSNCCVPNKFTY